MNASLGQRCVFTVLGTLCLKNVGQLLGRAPASRFGSFVDAWLQGFEVLLDDLLCRERHHVVLDPCTIVETSLRDVWEQNLASYMIEFQSFLSCPGIGLVRLLSLFLLFDRRQLLIQRLTINVARHDLTPVRFLAPYSFRLSFVCVY